MSPLQVAVYISGHGYGHFTRTLNLLSLLSPTGNYNFHIRTSSPLYAEHLKYALHPNIIQTNPYQLDAEQSMQSLQSFDPSIAEREEASFLKEQNIQAVISDAPSLPCLLAHSLGIPSILVTNFTFDSIFQALLDDAPESMDKAALQLKIDEMTGHYALARAVVRLPGYIPFLFKGPQIIDAPIHFRKAVQDRSETLTELGLQCLEDKKILLHCFGGHALDTPTRLPKLPEGWACVSQTIDAPPFFYKISNHVYMPDLIGACDAVLGKMGWGTCSEVIGNGCKPFIYVPRSAFKEEAGLLTWMEDAHRGIFRLEIEDYENSDWHHAIKETESTNRKISNTGFDASENNTRLIRIFQNLLSTS